MNKLGFLVDNLGCSQLGFFLIKNTNTFLANNLGLDPVVFYERLFPPTLEPHFATMQIAEAYTFKGPLIATNLNTARKLLNFASDERKYFYVWDLEWIRRDQKHWLEFAGVYNSRLTLLCRSKSHKQIVENCWNKPVKAVIQDFNMDQLAKEVFNG